MTSLSSGAWIDHFLTSEPPRHKSLVMTLCGDTIAPHGGAFWLGSMIELLGPLGVSDRLVRTSVFRLVQEGWLVASREGRRSRYALEPKALPRFERANRRIYSAPGLHWDGRWTFVLAPNGSIDGDRRNQMSARHPDEMVPMNQALGHLVDQDLATRHQHVAAQNGRARPRSERLPHLVED